ncbi:MAG: hypothetical protein PVG24_05030 [Gammaproteobacteria bacterium]
MKPGYALSGLMLLVLASSAQAQSGCDRACLEGHVSDYLDALYDNTPAAVPLARGAKISDNNRLVGLREAFWENAQETAYRWDIANPRLGDVATEVVIRNSDGSYTMAMVRLKVLENRITEVEVIRADEGDADRLWGPERLVDYPLSRNLTNSIRVADRDSYYRLIAAAESYWRAFQTNGTAEYHRADLLFDTDRFENGLQTTGRFPDGTFRSAPDGFDTGRFIGRNLWDRRYPVVDEERGIVLSIVRFGLKDGMESQSVVTSNDRLVGEFFEVKNGMIQEVHAVLYNLPDEIPSVWEAEYGPGRGGW